MTILLFGPNGQVGWELQRALGLLGHVFPLDCHGRDGLRGDLTDPDALREAIRTMRPSIIVNAAAYTAVDRAEFEPERAAAVNATAPGVMAEQAKAQGALLVHYSTDYVFDGSGRRPWRESDATGPLNVYGRTKLDGEEAIHASGCAYLIFRTSWVYAARGKNFIRTMLRLAKERDALQVIDDQYGAPTGAELIADVTARALPVVTAHPECARLYHLAAAGEITWHGYARWVIEQARAAGWPVRVADEAIARVPTEAFPVQATRPRNSRLDCSRLEEAFGLSMPDWQQGAHHALTEILACEGTAGE